MLYIFSFIQANKQALIEGKEKPKFFSQELYKHFLYSLLIAVICFVIFIVSTLLQVKDGEYVPAKMENGKLIKGHKS
jgi:hypothetical protein